MATLRNNQLISLRVTSNPHRYGSPNRDRFNLLRSMIRLAPVAVGDFIRAHNEQAVTTPSLGGTFEARRYLRYEVERNEIEIAGFVLSRRGPRTAPAPLPMVASSVHDFTFGVEIECYLPRGISAQEAATALSGVGIDCRVESLSHSVRTWWKIVTDGSLHDYDRGREFVSPILQGRDGLRQVETVCRKLKEMGATVNKSTGFHVHVGCDANADNPGYFVRLHQLYGRNERILDGLMAPSRRGAYGASGMCRSVQVPAAANYETVAAVCRSIGATGGRSSARYRKLNVDCWFQYRTAEFRHHGGTVEADKACNWVQFCLHLCALAASSKELPSTNLHDLMSSMDLSDDLKTFFNNRAAHFAAANLRRAA